MAREIQRAYGQEPEVTSRCRSSKHRRRREMSKSLGNYIESRSAGRDLWKNHAHSDALIVKYYELVSSMVRPADDVRRRLGDPSPIHRT